MKTPGGRFLQLAFVCLVGLSAVPSAALAQATDSSSDSEARARFEEGRAAYDAGRFDDAVRAFQRAYLLSARYALLFNIGQSQLRAGHDAQALAAFEAFLRQAPEGDAHRAEVTERVAVLHSMGVTASTEGAATTTTTSTTTTTTPVTTTTASDTTTTTTAATDTTTTTTTDATPPPPSSADSGPGIAPWIVLGGGAALVVVGAVLMAVGAGQAGSVTGAPDGAHWADLMGTASDANTLWGVGIALGLVGLAAVGGGLAWALVGGSSSASDAASARLELTGNGLRIAGSF